jgi:MarR family transcriptional regulator, organic hydroperoxide resistance regulator
MGSMFTAHTLVNVPGVTVDRVIITRVTILPVIRPADVSPPSTGYLLGHVALRWRAEMDRALAPLGLTSTQYALLASLFGLTQAGARPSQRELADFAGLEPMSVSKLARGLERAGLLARAVNADDPRAVQLAVTPHGTETIVKAVGIVRDLHDHLLAPLGGRHGARKAQFDEALTALLRHLTAIAEARAADRSPRKTGVPDETHGGRLDRPNRPARPR